MTDKVNESITTKVAVISVNVENIKSDISEIKQGIKELSGVYATQVQVKELADQLAHLAETLKEISNKQSGLQRYITPIISSAATGVIVVLVLNYLQHIK